MEARVRIHARPARLTTEHKNCAQGEPVLIFLGQTLHPGDSVRIEEDYFVARDLPMYPIQSSDAARELIARFRGRPMMR